MRRLSLNGRWKIECAQRKISIPASVPGDVYGDLLAASEIPDPFYRDNEDKLQWVGESDWSYSRTFAVTKSLLASRHILLRCDGLDTFARVTVNGIAIAETDNMFRTYEWDIKALLKAGENMIRIEFSSVLPYIRERMAEHPGWGTFAHSAAYAGWVRKEQCNFGWDWGIKAVTCGIWKDITIIAYDEGRLTDICIRQKHSRNKVDLLISAAAEGTAKGLMTEVTVLDSTQPVTSGSGKIIGTEANLELRVSDPKLWWPNTMGEQPLYMVKVALRNEGGEVIDVVEKRIGLRTLELDRHDDEWGESFQFAVNGVPFFAKGANWIPVDAILARRTPESYRRLLKDAAGCNMNMLRVWGGGIYEDDVFYDTCDELGICVWQDFMFACAAYPTFLKGFLDNVKAEARDAIIRLRHHPSLALWCGNNELEMMNVGDDGWESGKMPWQEYGELFDELLPAQVRDLSPETPYWPSSPHSPNGDRKQHRNPACGDAHLWIMSGRYPLDCARGMDHRFASEFGFQSFPEPKTVAGYTSEGDENISSRIMEHHQRAPSGNETMMQQILKCLCMPNGFKNTLWASQIMQGAGVKAACEHFRRNMPRTMGALYWQLNDCWPVASWASIDYHGRWKALQYMARHFFAPVMISGVEHNGTGEVDIHLTSDRLQALAATVSWTVTDVSGAVLDSGRKRVKTPANSSCVVRTLKLQKLLNAYRSHVILVWLEVDAAGGFYNRNLVLFSAPKHLELSKLPGIKSVVRKGKDGAYCVELTAAAAALWVWLELEGVDARFSDNFFHLRPGICEWVIVRPARGLSAGQLRKLIRVRSLVDTY